MLKLAGYLNLLISFFHIVFLFRLEDAFRLTGVSDQMAEAAAVWPYLPLAMTLFVAVVFAVFGIYGLAGAGVVKWKLPLLKPVIYTIGAIYTLRGLTGLAFRYTSEIPGFLQTLFALVALGIGILYVVGGMAVFSRD